MRPIEIFEHPKHWDGGRLSVTICSYGPVDPLAVAKTMTATVKLLNSVAKNKGEKDCAWMLIEAAVIGDKAAFTLQGVSRKALAATRRKARKDRGVPPVSPSPSGSSAVGVRE